MATTETPWTADATAAELVAALEPFGDMLGEDCDEYGDDTPVVVKCGRSTYYALNLGDFRRARALLSRVRS